MDEPLPQQQDLLQPAPEPAPAASDAVVGLQIQAQDFRLLFNATFLGLIALALAVNLFFGKQMLMVRRQIERTGPAVNQDDTNFRRYDEPRIHVLMKQLQNYAATHPEYQTGVLARYRVALGPYFSTAVIVGQPPPIPQGSSLAAPRPPPGRTN